MLADHDKNYDYYGDDDGAHYSTAYDNPGSRGNKTSTLLSRNEVTPDIVETSSTLKRIGQSVHVVENQYYGSDQVKVNQCRNSKSRKQKSSTLKKGIELSPDVVEKSCTLKRMENPYYGGEII